MPPPLLAIAGGSIIGADHVRDGRGSQDAYTWITTDTRTVAVVTDGCSSGRSSEVGAKIGARLFARCVLAAAPESLASPAGWEGVRGAILQALHEIAEHFGGDLSQTLAHYFLFTLVGAVITPETTYVVSIGDGLYALNGEVVRLGPFPDNAPPYIAYDLFTEHPVPGDRHFVVRSFPTDTLQTLALGTDGLEPFLTHPRYRERDAAVGLARFWTDPTFLADPGAIARELAALNLESVRYVPGAHARFGAFHDDCTLVVLGRKPVPVTGVNP